MRRLDISSDMEKVLRVLSREKQIDALSSLIYSVKGDHQHALLASSALVIDANAVLRIPIHPKSSDIIDYIAGVHRGPIVLPGQVVQEFWNNQASVAATVFQKIQSRHLEFKKEVDRTAEAGVSDVEEISAAVSKFRVDNDHVFDPETVKKTAHFLERLEGRVIVPYAPRKGLAEVASHRKRAKTPPGFKDDGDGDFLVWVDTLFGLLKAKKQGIAFTDVILLSNDKKIDWCRGSIAHPILHAEMKALLGSHFEVWTLDLFAQAVSVI